MTDFTDTEAGAMNKHDTLLIACGTTESRKILRDNLGENYNLLEAGNARQTMLLLEQNRSCIAAVILDITAKKAREDAGILWQESDSLAGIPVIVITEDDEVHTLDYCFSLGASDVIPLTYDPYAMVRRIENLVQLHLHRNKHIPRCNFCRKCKNRVLCRLHRELPLQLL